MKNFTVFGFAVAMLVLVATAFAGIPQPAYTTEMVADAASRSSLTQSATDNFKLGGVSQFRYSYRNVNDGQNSYGFEMPYLRLDISGNISEEFSYLISPKVDENGDFSLENAFIQTNLGPVQTQIGQFRPQFLIETNVSREFELVPYRSVVASTLGQNFTQGVQGHYGIGSRVNLYASFTDGNGQADTAVLPQNNGYGFNFRAEGAVWNDYSDPLHLIIGGAWSNQNDTNILTADARMRIHDFGFSLAYVYGEVNSNSGFNNNLNSNTYNAFLGEAYYNITDRFQPYVRQEFGRVANGANLNISRIGANYYLVDKVVKWSNDIGYSYGETDGNWNYTDTGFVTTTGRQFVLTSQLQILF